MTATTMTVGQIDVAGVPTAVIDNGAPDGATGNCAQFPLFSVAVDAIQVRNDFAAVYP